MQRVKRSSAVVALPTAPGGGTPGYFALPNPGGGVPATVPGYEWFNSVQEEICAVIAAAGITLDIANTGQLLAALPGALAASSAMARSLVQTGYQKLPGGLILQWGYFTETGTPLATGSYLTRTQNLPISFNTALVVIGSSALNYVHCGSSFASVSQLQHRFSSDHTGALNLDISWLAIGY